MNKTVLITGGTTGIGKQTAIVLGKRGWNVAFTSRNKERGSQFEKELKEMNITATFYQLDVTDEEAVKNVIEAVIKDYGKMDCIVNNAGIAGENNLFADCSTENFRSMIETNIMGVYYGMKYAVRHYLKTGGGKIVNLASIAGLNGIPYAAQYCATKHAVVGLTKAVAVEYADKNIRVNAVAPGACDTEILQAARDAGNYDDSSLKSMHPMQRMGKPVEIANTIAFLASDDVPFMTGAIISADGGYNAK